jgi:RNA polymerase sigma-70 factor (ECF subfamily)
MGAIAYCFANPMELETQELARGLRRRDPELLDHLIERYQFRLYRYLVFLTGSRETAEDLFQETWLRVLERGRQYDGKSPFEPWLFRIARNLAIDRARRKPMASLEAALETPDGGAPREIEAETEVSAFDLVARGEQQASLSVALTQLPAAYREVLSLRFQEELALEEIAAVVGAPLSTVKSRLYRGLEALRERLEGERQ